MDMRKSIANDIWTKRNSSYAYRRTEYIEKTHNKLITIVAFIDVSRTDQRKTPQGQSVTYNATHPPILFGPVQVILQLSAVCRFIPINMLL